MESVQKRLAFRRHARRKIMTTRRLRTAPPLLEPLFIQSRAYQTSVTLPASVVPTLALWTRIVSALFTSMYIRKFESMDTMTCPCVLLVPLVMAVAGDDCKPTDTMPPLGIWNKLT